MKKFALVFIFFIIFLIFKEFNTFSMDTSKTGSSKINFLKKKLKKKAKKRSLDFGLEVRNRYSKLKPCFQKMFLSSLILTFGACSLLPNFVNFDDPQVPLLLRVGAVYGFLFIFLAGEQIIDDVGKKNIINHEEDSSRSLEIEDSQIEDPVLTPKIII